tara:strand:+ start:44 stop:397 length:354 start_codon:yes stop_codon:yes gene_type:complete
MTSIKDHHDASRDQYISHKLYLERRAGNRYYNLGYMMYKGIVSNPQTIPATPANLQDAMMNFDIALLFNQNDVDAKARKKDLCDKYGPNGTTQQHMTQQIIDAARNEAKKIYKGCKC